MVKNDNLFIVQSQRIHSVYFNGAHMSTHMQNNPNEIKSLRRL